MRKNLLCRLLKFFGCVTECKEPEDYCPERAIAEAKMFI